MKPVYCDFIAHAIKRRLSKEDDLKIGNIKYDLHPEEGWYLSPKKTIEVEDWNGKKYTVTVEESHE